MTRTTELLKEIEKLDKNGVSLTLIKCELSGRLDALKEEVEWLIETFGEEYDCDDFDILLQKRIASIREEIKLIENAGVGK